MDDLFIPIYIDTNALLDLLASIEGGFSVVEKITSVSGQIKGKEGEVSAGAGTEFGILNFLNLIKLNLSGSIKTKREQETKEEKSAERYHTYGSMLFRLRNYLKTRDEDSILDIEDPDFWDKVNLSTFVEIRGIFTPNPLENYLEIADRLLKLSSLFTESNLTPTKNSSPPTKNQRNQSAQNSTSKQMESVRRIFHGILSDIQQENAKRFLIEPIDDRGIRSVLLLYIDYLRNKSTREISNRQFYVLGKVVRIIERDSEEKIDLLAETGLGGIGRDVLEQLMNTLNLAPNMNLPKVETEIKGPAIEIVPIAVFI